MKQLLVILISATLSRCFNVNDDVRSVFPPKAYSGPKGSQFGYTVALQEAASNWLLVGVPALNDAGIVQSGGLYKCDPKGTGAVACSQVSFNDPGRGSGNNRRNSHLGLALATIDSEVLVCAPQHAYFPSAYDVYPRGRCSLLDGDLRHIVSYNPCSESTNWFSKFCVAGVSASLAKSATEVRSIIGIPVLYNFNGANGVQSTLEKNAVFTSTDRINDQYSAHMGYSLSHGMFTGNTFGEFVGGAPRADLMRGLVILYALDKNLPMIQAIENPNKQVGAFFGGAVLAVDLNNDGKDDLLVGSPHYSVISDEGQVYIYMNKKASSFSGLDKLSKSLDGGNVPNSRFGATIANLGDINLDGFLDIAVGAPAGGRDGAGAVFIYNGGPEGLKNNFLPTQVLHGADFGVTTFGNSISGGVDMDGNVYPDIAVGSFAADTVHLFMTRPIIIMASKLIPSTARVPADKSNCALDGRQYFCITLDLCLSYGGVNVKQGLDVDVEFVLDSDQSGNRRAGVDDGSGNLVSVFKRKIVLKETEESCAKDIKVYITTTGQFDVLSAITLQAKYFYSRPAAGCAPDLCPVMDSFSPSVVSTQISYQKGCDADGDEECSANLVLDAQLGVPGSELKEVVYGANYQLNMDVAIENKGENAYQVVLKVKFPTDLKVQGIEIVGKSYLLWDVVSLTNDTNQLSLPVASLIREKQELNLLIKFAVETLRPSSAKLTFDAEVSSVSQETKPADNKKLVQIATAIDTCLKVSLEAVPKNLFYSDHAADPSLNVSTIGHKVEFVVFVQNNGRLPVEFLSAEFEITEQVDKHYLLYPTDITLNGVPCPNQFLNPLNFTLENALAQVNTNTSRNRRDTSLDCRSGICKSYNCEINRIESGSDVTMRITARVWESNFAKLKLDSTKLMSYARLEFKGSNANLMRPRRDCKMDKEISVTVKPATEEGVRKKVPWWQMLLAILGAILLLLALIGALYKIGFFKRKRKIKEITGPGDAPPTDPGVTNPVTEEDE